MAGRINGKIVGVNLFGSLLSAFALVRASRDVFALNFTGIAKKIFDWYDENIREEAYRLLAELFAFMHLSREIIDFWRKIHAFEIAVVSLASLSIFIRASSHFEGKTVSSRFANAFGGPLFVMFLLFVFANYIMYFSDILSGKTSLILALIYIPSPIVLSVVESYVVVFLFYNLMGVFATVKRYVIDPLRSTPRIYSAQDAEDEGYLAIFLYTIFTLVVTTVALVFSTYGELD